MDAGAFEATPNLSHYHYVEVCKTLVKAFLEEHAFPESHGYGHALQVLRYCEEALAIEDPFGWKDLHLVVGLAALLHEVDDRKYSKGGAGVGLPNASRLLDDVFARSALNWSDVKRLTLRAIGLVSAHENGNGVPAVGAPDFHPLMLVVRYADRLAATGEEGIIRCLLYTRERGRPLFLPETPSPSTEAELAQVLKARPLSAYCEGAGESATMLDHVYEKLLHISCPPTLVGKVRIPALAYLEGRLRERAAPLVRLALAPRHEVRDMLAGTCGANMGQHPLSIYAAADYNDEGQLVR